MGIKVVSVEQMQAIEAAADQAGHSYDAMMERAGGALADYLLKSLRTTMGMQQIVFLIGPGNNGGDGLVAARKLRQEMGMLQVAAYMLKARDDDNLEQAEQVGVDIILASEDEDYGELYRLLGRATILVDALFGTGTRLPIEGDAATLLEVVHETLGQRQGGDQRRSDLTYPTAAVPAYSEERIMKIAVDCPSGLDCDTGELDPLTIHADATVTFDSVKIGLLMFPGADAAGKLVVADIGVPAEEKEDIPLRLVDAVFVQKLLPERSSNTHKGTFGKTMIVGGSTNYIGAPYMAGMAAYRAGTGLVTIGAPQIIIPALAGMLPEATWLLLPHDMGVLSENAASVLRKELKDYDALLVGPGIGKEEETRRFLEKLLYFEEPEKTKPRQIGFAVSSDTDVDSKDDSEGFHMPPLVVDADALNILAEIKNWWELLPENTILTPHPGEFARLTGLDEDETKAIEQIQENRLGLALEYAEKWNCVVVLKGAFTIVAEPGGEATISPFASSALSTAGTGDILAGVIASLLAQGLTPAEAAIAGVWIHACAGEQAREAQGNAASIIATDLLEYIGAAYVLLDHA